MSDNTLADSLLREIRRNIVLVGQYESIGPAGGFGKAAILEDLLTTFKAAMENDLPKLIQCHEALKGNQ